MIWGAKNKVGQMLINMRSETALEKFSAPMRVDCCLIPASGYYEWQGDGTNKAQYSFSSPQGVIYMAGCYWAEERSTIAKFVILTRAATEAFKAIHDRMPVVIRSERIDEWLNRNPDAMGDPILDFACERVK